MKKILLTLIFFLVACAPQVRASLATPALAIPAFPGCQGFGCSTPGGRGGSIVYVTNLNDSGAGSLRAALSQSGARIVVFKVGGVAQINTALYINNPYITILGQTAPGMGFVIKGSPLNVRTHDVIVQGLKFRIGDGVGEVGDGRDGITLWGDASHQVYNVVIDHNSVSWAVDENISTWDDTFNGSVHDVTFSWNISTEALECSIHPDGCHSMGFLVGEGTKNISIHHNLIASNGDRNPRLGGGTSGDMINNVIYNWDSGNTNVTSYANMGALSLPVNWDIIQNTWLPTINTNEMNGAKRGINIECKTTGKVFTDDWANVNFMCANAAIKAASPVNPSGVIPQAGYFEAVLNWAGSIPRDSVDARAVSTTRTGTKPGSGWLVNSPSEAGGYPAYPPGVLPPDADGDGLPDSFETVDYSPLGYSPEGYQWIEVYAYSLLNQTVPGTPTKTITSTSAPIPTLTATKTPISPTNTITPTFIYVTIVTDTPKPSATPSRTPVLSVTPTKTQTVPTPTATPASLPTNCTLVFQDATYNIYACPK